MGLGFNRYLKVITDDIATCKRVGATVLRSILRGIAVMAAGTLVAGFIVKILKDLKSRA